MPTTDPTELAAELPDRPLTPSEVGDLGETFGWSIQRVIFETVDNSREYVPEWWAFDHSDEHDGEPVGDVYGFYMDDELAVWSADILAEDVPLSLFSEVGEAFAAELGMDAELESITITSDGGELHRELE